METCFFSEMLGPFACRFARLTSRMSASSETALALWHYPVFEVGPAPPPSRRLERAIQRLQRLRETCDGADWFLHPRALAEAAQQLQAESFVIIDSDADDDLRSEVRAALGDGGSLGRVTAGAASALRSDISVWWPLSTAAAAASPRLTSLVARVDRLVAALRDGRGNTSASAAVTSVAAQLSGVRRRSEPMLAWYPSNGSQYVRHYDNLCTDGRGARCNGRRLTAVSYANPPRMPPTDGALRIFGSGSASSPPRLDVAPLAGRTVLFWSDERVPHAVLPSRTGERYAVTLWYFDEVEMLASNAAASAATAQF